MKKTFLTLTSLILIVALLAGCSSSKNYSTAMPSAPQTAAEEYGYDTAASMAPDADMSGMRSQEGEKATFASGNTPGEALSDRKIIKNGSIELETLEFDKGVESISALVDELGGYIEFSDVSGNSLRYRGSYNQRSASFTARIPANQLSNATHQLGELFNVLSKSENVSDITDTYYDTEGRLKSLRVQEERLLELLSKAEKLEDLITLEQALAEVRYQIESLTTQLTRFDSLVSYSTLTIYLNEVAETTSVKTQPRTLGEKVAEAFTGSLQGIANIAEFLLLTAVSVGPVLLVYGGVVALLALAILQIAKARNNRKKQPPMNQPPEDKN